LEQTSKQNSRLSIDLEVKSNECLTLQSKIIELNNEMTKLQEDHCVTITQLNQSLKETQELRSEMECSLQRIIDQLKDELNQTSKREVQFLNEVNQLKKEVEDVRFDKEREVAALQTSLNQLQLELNEVLPSMVVEDRLKRELEDLRAEKSKETTPEDNMILFSNVLESLDVSLFQELHVIKRGIKLLEKDRKYRELTIEIETARRTDLKKALPLSQQRLSLQYNPSQPPEGMLSEEELRSRGLIVLDRLSERELFLLDLGEESSQICESYRRCLLGMFEGVNVSLSIRNPDVSNS